MRLVCSVKLTEVRRESVAYPILGTRSVPITLSRNLGLNLLVPRDRTPGVAFPQCVEIRRAATPESSFSQRPHRAQNRNGQTNITTPNATRESGAIPLAGPSTI